MKIKIFICLFGFTLLGCSTIKQDDVIEVQRICTLIITNPDTLISIRRDSTFSFNTTIYRKSRDNQIYDSNTVIYIKRWFSKDYLIDTSYVYSRKYPYFNGKSTELLERTIYRVEYRSNLTDIEFDKIENRYVCFEFLYIDKKWLLDTSDTLNLYQMHKKFNKLLRNYQMD